MRLKYTDNLKLKMPGQTEFYNVDDFNENAEIIDKELSKMNRKLTLTFTAAGWSDTAPYTQLVAVEGITADDVPEVYLYYPDTINETNAEAYVEAYGYINKVDTQENAINVTAFYEKPAVDITIALKGV